jgi:hypothetical protein
MGHSDMMHSLYAANTRLPAEINFHVFFQMMRTSGVWHHLVGFTGSRLLHDMEPRDHISIEMPAQHDHRSDCSSDPKHFSSSLSTMNIAEWQVKKILISDLVRIHMQMQANDLVSLLDTVGFNLESSSSRALAQPVTHLLHPSWLDDLWGFLGNDSASFKHPQQAEAVELIASKTPSILLIGPTGKLIPVLGISSLLFKIFRAIYAMHVYLHHYCSFYSY